MTLPQDELRVDAQVRREIEKLRHMARYQPTAEDHLVEGLAEAVEAALQDWQASPADSHLGTVLDQALDTFASYTLDDQDAIAWRTRVTVIAAQHWMQVMGQTLPSA